MKKIISLLLAIFVLCACSVSTSSSTTTTFSTTDSSGNTTTTTTTTENGVTTTDTITSSEDDPTGLRAKWHELFTGGAEGVSSNGDYVYFIYDNLDDVTYAGIMILSSDQSELEVYDLGEVQVEDDHFVIIDVEGETTLPFYLPDTPVENGFEIAFKDGDVAQMRFVDIDTIIDDMVSIWESVKTAQ